MKDFEVTDTLDPEYKPNPQGAERWDKFLFQEALAVIPNDGVILEIGCIRHFRDIDARADGHSTVKWAQSGRDTICVDTSKEAISECAEFLDNPKNVEFAHCDGLEYLKKYDGQIALLYLDGPDPKNGGVQFSVDCYDACKNIFVEGAIILIDDCDITPGKGDAVIPKALEDDFELVLRNDRQVILKKKSVQALAQSVKKVGLVGYNCHSGLGELNRQITTYGKISSWLIKRHAQYPSLARPFGIDCKETTSNQAHIENFVNSVDVVLFCETPFFGTLVQTAKEKNKRVVCVPMIEWLPKQRTGWTQKVDLFICPTKQCYDMVKSEGLPCEYFPWPVDVKRFKFVERKKCESFLFINGRGGWHGRKGLKIIEAALQKWPEFPITIISQKKVSVPGARVLKSVKDNDELYSLGDVLIAPHSVDGIGLEPFEAMACGLPVMTPDNPPWNENPAIVRLETMTSPHAVGKGRIMDWNVCPWDSLVDECKNLLGTDISEESKKGREFVENLSWENNVNEFMKIVKGV